MGSGGATCGLNLTPGKIVLANDPDLSLILTFSAFAGVYLVDGAAAQAPCATL
jgi:hypothetical protein